MGAEDGGKRAGGGGGEAKRDEGVSKPKREAGSCTKQPGVHVVAVTWLVR